MPANIRECAGPGGPLLEKIRLDNATAQSRGAAGRIKTDNGRRDVGKG